MEGSIGSHCNESGDGCARDHARSERVELLIDHIVLASSKQDSVLSFDVV